MRTIKFRGRDAVHPDHPWRYGDLTHGMRITDTGTAPRIMVGGYEVDPETVGQFIGIQDRLFHDIYEGDIIRHEGKNPLLYEVKFVSTGFNGWRDKKFIHLDSGFITIVGNIHEQ